MGTHTPEQLRRFGIRDLRNDTTAVLEAMETDGAALITRHGRVVAKLSPVREGDESRSPSAALIDRVLAFDATDTGWLDELAADKAASIDAQDDDPWA